VSTLEFSQGTGTQEMLQNSPGIDSPPHGSKMWGINQLNCSKEYDKGQVLRLKIAEAGPGADAKTIQRQLFELGDFPNRWRGWSQLYKREKQALFENLQVFSLECLALTNS
jgi:hypothetical protein